MYKYDREEVLKKIQPFMLLSPVVLEYCGGQYSLNYQLIINHVADKDKSHQKMWIDWLASVGIKYQWDFTSFLTIQLEEDDFLKSIYSDPRSSYIPV